jgi:hypothetical protein
MEVDAWWQGKQEKYPACDLFLCLHAARSGVPAPFLHGICRNIGPKIDTLCVNVRVPFAYARLF